MRWKRARCSVFYFSIEICNQTTRIRPPQSRYVHSSVTWTWYSSGVLWCWCGKIESIDTSTYLNGSKIENSAIACNHCPCSAQQQISTMKIMSKNLSKCITWCTHLKANSTATFEFLCGNAICNGTATVANKPANMMVELREYKFIAWSLWCVYNILSAMNQHINIIAQSPSVRTWFSL